MRLLHRIFLGLALSTATACSAASDDDSPAPSTEASDLGVASHATAFGCGLPDGDADLGLRFSADGKRVTAELGLDNIVTGKGELDATYRPTAANEGFVRFTGFRGIAADAESFSDGQWVRVTLLVEKPLLQGKSGHAKLQIRYEAGRFEQTDNVCTP